MGPQSYEDFFSSQSKMGKLREVQSLRYYEEAVKKINNLGWNYKTELLDGLIKTYQDYELNFKKVK